MANTEFMTRIQLKHDTLANWKLVEETFKPLRGELCVVEIPTGATENPTTNSLPVHLVKIGDGTNFFKDLPYLAARSADVASFLKNDENGNVWTKTSFETWIKSLIDIGDIDASGLATVEALNAEINRAKAAEAQALADAKTYADGKDSAMNTRVAAMEGKVANWDAAEQNAKDYADGLNTAMQGKLDEEVNRAKGAEQTNAQAAADALAEAQAKVASVTAADNSMAVGGTTTAPTVAVKLSQDADNAMTLEDDGLKVVIPAAAEYSIVKAADSGDYAAVYNLTKGGEIVGASINIPKDMVVESGAVVENPAGQPAGTYIKLVLQNVAEPLYVNVGSLIEYVTSGSTAGDMVVVNVSDDHKVTAVITDGTITLAKLHTDIQTAIGKAHTHENATVLAGITADNVAAWGAAEQNAKSYADGLNTTMQGEVNGLKDLVGTTSVESQIDAAITALDLDNTYDAKGAAATVQTNLDNLKIEELKQTDYIILSCGDSKTLI